MPYEAWSTDTWRCSGEMAIQAFQSRRKAASLITILALDREGESVI